MSCSRPNPSYLWIQGGAQEVPPTLSANVFYFMQFFGEKIGWLTRLAVGVPIPVNPGFATTLVHLNSRTPEEDQNSTETCENLKFYFCAICYRLHVPSQKRAIYSQDM